MAYRQPPPSPIELSFWEVAKPRIPDLQREVWVDRKYRVDFLVPNQKVVIELYGYKYHNSKQKLTKDAERERYLQRNGYQVVRFTGSEVHKDVDRCVTEALAIIHSQRRPIPKELVQTPQIAVSQDLNRGQLLVRDQSRSDRVARIMNSRNSVLNSVKRPTSPSRPAIWFGMHLWQIAILGSMFVAVMMALAILTFLMTSGF
jgi:very-short-patch-repair endonuclease